MNVLAKVIGILLMTISGIILVTNINDIDKALVALAGMLFAIGFALFLFS